MSRFFKQEGDSNSDTEESEEELLSESESADDDESDSDGDAAQPQKKVSRSRPDQEDDSEDEDDVKRIVKSAKDKRLEEMEGTGKAIDNALKSITGWLFRMNLTNLSALLKDRPTSPNEYHVFVSCLHFLLLASQREVDQLIAIVMGDPSYSVQEITEDYDEFVERSPADEKDGVVRIRGSIISFVDCLDDEFTKSLQNIDPHGTEYVDRLKDEKGFIMRRLEHIYSKPDAVIQALEQTATQSKLVPSTTLATQGSGSSLIHSLSVSLYKSDNSFLRTRAMLCHIYHHALANEFYVARDMLLMSHLQESVHAADVATQILYNRTVVQLGLCAFRKGLIREAQSTLQRVKELLAQGVHQQRYQTLTPEQEKADRQRQLPFHMHINTELLEAAFLVSSMLVQIPLLASIDDEELKRKAISKPFRQVFTGPPETPRDHIMQASKALQGGEWEKCRDLIQSIKIWSLMPGAQSVKDMLARRIQEEGLRTYLFTYALYYSTLLLSLLSRTFSLSLRTVTSTVSKMIWNEELAASLDQSSGVVVFHRAEVTCAQQLAQSLAEKLGTMITQNEKGLYLKLGGGSTLERGDGLGNDGAGQLQEEALEEVEVQDLLKG
ncbi:eukaryotic translation initiation factor 3 subunit 8 N-terminus-domain-containing protein [Gautieria morchelliformis]|nr:eukaryotic translation initiation factor 3 subunit 8 N-terminus-domain-containing protein [Gautieria morchelliformis]